MYPSMKATNETLKDFRLRKVDKCPLCRSARRESFERRPASPSPMHAVRCVACGLIYTDAVVVEEELPRLYEGYNEPDNETDKELARKRKAMYALDYAFVRKYFDETDAKVLDIGCGEGKFLAYFTQARTYGVEVDQRALSAGKSAYPSTMFYRSLDAVKESQFDAVIFRGTLQLMPDLSAIAEYCASRLRTGGYVFALALPNADSLLAQLQREDWMLFDSIEHRYCFGIEQVKKLFAPTVSMVGYDLPYLGTPYEQYAKDYRMVLDMFENEEARKARVPFFGSMINIALQKK